MHGTYITSPEDIPVDQIVRPKHDKQKTAPPVGGCVIKSCSSGSSPASTAHQFDEHDECASEHGGVNRPRVPQACGPTHVMEDNNSHITTCETVNRLPSSPKATSSSPNTNFRKQYWGLEKKM